jgi:hypothetical protein
MELSEFERRVLEFLVAHDPEGETLRAQLAHATVLERDYTGVGVFVKLQIAESTPETILSNRYIQTTPMAFLRHPDLDPGAQALLWFADWRMDTLECVTMDGDPWPKDETKFQVEPYEVEWQSAGDA